MKHLGDITLIKGNEAPVVDCIIGGSPCQDLSLAGKRAGLAGARSGLYMEQIRIIKEMREQDVLRGRTNVDVRPRYMVWENVPGAFSTNQGKDFAAVLEEAIRVAEPKAPDVPVPDKGWPTSGCFYDVEGRWSIAWRVLDAQFWGTSDKPLPQRRRRIALVADFGGLSAPEILFVRKSVSGNIEPGEPKGKEAPGDAGEGSGGAGDECVVFNGANITSPINKANPQPGDPSHTLTDDSRNYLVLPLTYSIENHPADSRVDIDESGKVQTLTSRMGTGGGNVPMVMEPVTFADKASTLRAGAGAPKHESDFVGRLVAQPQTYQKVTGPLMANSHPGSYTGQDAFSDMLIAGVDCRNATEYPEMNGTIQSKSGGGFSLNCNQVVRVKHIVRRLTPLECERLQGFPDGWTDIGEWVDSKGKKHKEADSPRYKALGNSIAIPPWKWVLKRLCACYERDATMASLFDGIGGFPYIWEQLNGKGSCLWASEIEQFPMAVTKLRFGGGGSRG